MDVWNNGVPEYSSSEDIENAESEMSGNETRDRISELPDSLIHLIFSFLPMRQVVSTTLLSKRWNDLWTTVPCLDFKLRDYEYNNGEIFRNFVNRALILWRGTKILKFKVDFYFNTSVSSDLDLWVRLAIENAVEELHVSLDLGIDDEYGYWAPQRLYSCSSIKKLYLSGCNLEIYGKVDWKQLKFLRIEGVCISGEVIDQVLSSTPQLEVLILFTIEWSGHLDIRSSSLKKLEFQMHYDFLGGLSDTVLNIWTPNLEMLEISGLMSCMFSLENVSSLIDANLLFYGQLEEDASCSVILGEILVKQIFQRIHHVEKLELSDWCIERLGEMEKKDLLSPFLELKFLKLHPSRHTIGLGGILNLLEMSPKLEILVFDCTITGILKERYMEPRTNFQKSFLLHLKTVEINCDDYDTSILSLIEFLLKHGRVLEKMVIRSSRIESIESLFLATQKLLRMPRSSPNAEVILIKCCPVLLSW